MKKLVIAFLCILAAQSSFAGRETGGGSGVESYIMTRFLDFRKFLVKGSAFIQQQRFSKILLENPGVNTQVMFKNADDLIQERGLIIRVEKPLPPHIAIALSTEGLEPYLIECDLNFHTFCTAFVALKVPMLHVNYDRFLEEARTLDEETFDKTLFHEFIRLIGINDNLNRQSLPLYKSYLQWKAATVTAPPKASLLIDTNRELLNAGTLNDIKD